MFYKTHEDSLLYMPKFLFFYLSSSGSKISSFMIYHCFLAYSLEKYDILCIFKDKIPDEFIQILPVQILDVWYFTQSLYFILVLKDTEDVRLFHNYSITPLTPNILWITIIAQLWPILITENNKMFLHRIHLLTFFFLVRIYSPNVRYLISSNFHLSLFCK